jgi:hypothetical protein
MNQEIGFPCHNQNALPNKLLHLFYNVPAQRLLYKSHLVLSKSSIPGMLAPKSMIRILGS